MYRFEETPSCNWYSNALWSRRKTRDSISITTRKWCGPNCIKGFKERYREEKHQLAFLKPLSSLAGLKVCSRYIVTTEEHTSAIEKSEDLANSIVMPWIEGPTWAIFYKNKNK